MRECQIVFLQACTVILTYLPHFNDFDINLHGIVHFKAALVAMSVKTCKVICPLCTFKACNLTLTYFSHSNDFDINLYGIVHFKAVMIAVTPCIVNVLRDCGTFILQNTEYAHGSEYDIACL